MCLFYRNVSMEDVHKMPGHLPVHLAANLALQLTLEFSLNPFQNKSRKIAPKMIILKTTIQNLGNFFRKQSVEISVKTFVQKFIHYYLQYECFELFFIIFVPKKQTQNTKEFFSTKNSNCAPTLKNTASHCFWSSNRETVKPKIFFSERCSTATRNLVF